ncbi:MAG: GTPase HflX [Sphingomonadales bacterium]
MKALVVHAYQKSVGRSRLPDARLAESVALTRAMGLSVAGDALAPLARVHAGSFIGRGKIAEIGALLGETGAGLVVMDCTLSPIQQRNLEEAWNAKVIDRTALILEIFGRRARTREGELQVELAHLEYQRGRLVRSWTHLERQRGGFGFLGGPGERQIEADRRLIGERIRRLKSLLDDVRRTRGLHRRSRGAVPFPVIALVGYTNAGKSTLFNALTGGDAAVADLLFATLDPTMRAWKLKSGRRVILSDTVGFISELPTELVAAFRATLEEVLEADIIIHVEDAANPEAREQRSDVEEVLGRLDISPGRRAMILARNKSDLIEGNAGNGKPNQRGDYRGAVTCSALTGEGLGALEALVERVLAAGEARAEVLLDAAAGKARAWLYEHAEVIADEAGEAGLQLQVSLPERMLGYFKKHFAAEIKKIR